MNEVALEAGVSQTTVSLVLNEVSSAHFSAATRRRVLEAADRLGYQTNRRGGPQVASRGTIAFVVDEMSTDPWTAVAMDGICEAASAQGFAVWCAVTRSKSDVELSLLRQTSPSAVVGLIYGTINTRRVDPPVLARPLPTVLWNCYTADHALPSVVPAEVIGGQIATRRLIEAGHRRIGYINGEPWMDASRDRLRGYKRELSAANIPFDAALVRNGNWEPSTGYEYTLELMRLADPPTAIFCGNDLMALGCYDALRELGLSIPGDVAVIGYDSREIAQYVHPPLTTVLLPHFEMGVEAAECLIDLINGTPAPMRIKVQGQLVERNSV
ncbi:LacI family DNA-binding transcriptional regulator [bacterium]|nr:LacI family DNA-binding transcriptional regulator [bacterium]